MPRNYRPNVAAVIFNKNGDIWTGKRSDINNADEWQLPQGGININESPHKAIFREIYEETGMQSLKIISTIDDWISYDLPSNIAKIKWSGKYIGQKQKWFLIYFFGKDEEINIDFSDKPEFTSWKWDNEKKIVNNVVKFRKNVYLKVFNNFIPIINKYLKI